jgi:transposase
MIDPRTETRRPVHPGITWHLLSDPDARFRHLGPGYYAARIDPERRNRAHVRQLEALGYQVTLEPGA